MQLVEFQLLFLIFVANGAPVLGWLLLGRHGAWPVDGGLKLPDNRPLLGKSKTCRGVLFSLTATTVMAWLIGIPPLVGLIIGFFTMLGDLLSSFTKRRLGLPASSMALGLDQIPESLLPLLAVKEMFELDWFDILEIVAGFIVLGLLLSRILYWLNLRKRPY